MKAARTILSLNCKSNEADINKLAESMILIDAKADFLDSQARRHNVIIDGLPENENEWWSESEKVQIFLRDKLDLDPHTIGIEQLN